MAQIVIAPERLAGRDLDRTHDLASPGLSLWLSGSPALWLSSSLAFWLSGFLALRLSGSPAEIVSARARFHPPRQVISSKARQLDYRTTDENYNQSVSEFDHDDCRCSSWRRLKCCRRSDMTE